MQHSSLRNPAPDAARQSAARPVAVALAPSAGWALRGALAALAALALLCGAWALAARPAQAQPAAAGTERVIVVLNDREESDDAARDHEGRYAVKAKKRFNRVLKGYAADVSPAQRNRLERDRQVRFVVEDRQLRAFDFVPTGVRRVQAHVAGGAGFAPTPGSAVAVLDTGISLGHPDLNARAGISCRDGDPSVEDRNGHGTHIAGTIGAKDGNGDGTVVGVVPGITQYAVKVLNDEGVGYWSEVICGIDWVTANGPALGINVVNMSIGGDGWDDGNCGNTNRDVLHQAICRSTAAGITYIVAAGNSNADLAGTVPAAYDEVIAVTALADYNGLPGGGANPTCAIFGDDDSFATFSNYATGADLPHTVAAPGVCIVSTYTEGRYATSSGTSMAAPHVAGVAALYLARNPGATPAQVLAGLRASAEVVGAGHNNPDGRHPEPLVRAGAAPPARCDTASVGADLASPQPVGTRVVFTATASCTGPAEYLWWIQQPDGNWILAADWSPSPAVTWDTASLPGGIAQIVLWTRGQGSTDRHQAWAQIQYTVNGPGFCTTAQIASNLASPQPAGARVRFTGTAQCSSAAEYLWWIQQPDGAWVLAADWNPSPTLEWDTAALTAGVAQVVLWTRGQGSTDRHQAWAQTEYTLTRPGVCTEASIAADLAPPQIAGARVTFTATARCSNVGEYKWWIQRPDGVWVLAADWNPSPTLEWDTAGLTGGVAQIVLWTRGQGSTDRHQAWAQIEYALRDVPLCTVASISSDVAAPQRAGTRVTFTATAECTAPAEYKWWIQRPDGLWLLAADWNASATLEWDTTGLTAGAAQIVLWTRGQGAVDRHQAWAQIEYAVTLP